MSDIKRYRLDTDSFAAEHPQGDFVDYKDYAHLRAEVDNLRKNADISPSQSPHEIERLKAEVERLTKAGDAMQKSMLECGPNEMATAFHYDEWWVSYYGWNAAKEGKPSA